MEKLTKGRLETLLTQRLLLRDPQYFLEKVGGRLVGNIVSPTFRGKSDHRRQAMMWDALEDEFGRTAVTQVGMLLAFTPEEWNLDADVKATKTAKARKAG